MAVNKCFTALVVVNWHSMLNDVLRRHHQLCNQPDAVAYQVMVFPSLKVMHIMLHMVELVHKNTTAYPVVQQSEGVKYLAELA